MSDGRALDQDREDAGDTDDVEDDVDDAAGDTDTGVDEGIVDPGDNHPQSQHRLKEIESTYIDLRIKIVFTYS